MDHRYIGKLSLFLANCRATSRPPHRLYGCGPRKPAPLAGYCGARSNECTIMTHPNHMRTQRVTFSCRGLLLSRCVRAVRRFLTVLATLVVDKSRINALAMDLERFFRIAIMIITRPGPVRHRWGYRSFGRRIVLDRALESAGLCGLLCRAPLGPTAGGTIDCPGTGAHRAPSGQDRESARRQALEV
jgi:hypothetical protein